MKELYLDHEFFNGTEEEFLSVKKFFVKEWKLNGKWHRDNDPAVIYSCGSKYWYQNGKRHRVDGPAGIYIEGFKKWYFKGINLDDIFPLKIYDEI